MKVQKLTILQARDLLQKNEVEDLSLDIRIAETHHAPGGGEMIAYNSRLTRRALQFLAHRKRDVSAYIHVIVYDKKENAEAHTPRDRDALSKSVGKAHTRLVRRAEKVSQKIVANAQDVNYHAQSVYESVVVTQAAQGDFSKREVKQALSVFSIALRKFRQSTEMAIEEYMEHGNTLIMDLITHYDIDTASLKHALKVACFATELASMMGFESYFDDTPPEDIYGLLEEKPPKSFSEEDLEQKKNQLFKRELVEIFLGGFMHDAGLWQVGLQDGHEIRGAQIIAYTPQIETISKSLVDIVMFHSDIRKLAANQGVVRIFGLSKKKEIVAFQREYFKHAEEAHISENLQKGNFEHKIFTDIDLRKILPVAISEAYITPTHARKPIPRHDVITELVSFCEGGIYQKFIIAMCNTQGEAIAPARTLVNLDGRISVHINSQPRWLDVTGFQAVSIGHDDSRHAPHLITIFSKEPDGSQKILDYLDAQNQTLWDRADLDARMYISGGRFRSLSFTVSAVLRNDIYQKHFSAYEQEVRHRVSAALI